MVSLSWRWWRVPPPSSSVRVACRPGYLGRSFANEYSVALPVVGPDKVVLSGAAGPLSGPAKIPQLGQALGKTAKSVKAAAEVRRLHRHCTRTCTPPCRRAACLCPGQCVLLAQSFLNNPYRSSKRSCRPMRARRGRLAPLRKWRTPRPGRAAACATSSNVESWLHQGPPAMPRPSFNG